MSDETIRPAMTPEAMLRACGFAPIATNVPPATLDVPLSREELRFRQALLNLADPLAPVVPPLFGAALLPPREDR